MSTVINVSDLSKKYKNQQVLNNLNWQIQQGDVVGLLGKNGAGKSTLLKCMLNIIDCDLGEISLFAE